MPPAIDLNGRKFGRLIVQHRADSRNGKALWFCLCECGRTAEIASTSLIHGATHSCGCLRSETAEKVKLRHGCSRKGRFTGAYSSWADMRKRCTNRNGKNWEDYGGRGITVFDRWMLFDNFLEDMGERPKGLTLERKDNERGYEPGSCKWATRDEQAQNRRPMRRTRWQPKNENQSTPR